MTRLGGRGFALVIALFCFAFGLAAPAFAAAPTITSFTPTSGPLHTKVTITGANFASPATVKFNGAPSSSVVVNSATTITAVVPPLVSTGPVSVTTSGGTATSSGSFTVTPGLSLATSIGPPGSTAVADFSGFAAYEAVDVYFDTTDTQLVSASSTGTGKPTVTVPSTATPGTHYVTVVGRKSGYSAQAAYTVRTDWTQNGFDNFNTGLNPYENVLSPSTAGQLKQLWKTPAGTSIYSSQAVVAGVVYASPNDGTVRSFNATTGAAGWTTQLPGATTNYSSPEVVGGVVYVGGGTSHSLYALNASTGAVKWSYATGGNIYGSPKVVGNVVYFGSYDDKIYAVNATTGALIWSYATGDSVFATPAVANGIVYVVSQDGKLYALKATTGVSLWTDTITSSEALASPVVGDGVVYAAGGTALIAVDPDSGNTVWSAALPNGADSTPALDDGTLFIGDDSGTVSAFDAGDGTSDWSVTLPPPAVAATGLIESMTAADGVIYTGNASTTYALRESDGKRLRTLPTGSGYGGVEIINGTLLVAANGASSTPGLVTFALPSSANPAVKRPAAAALRPNYALRARA